MELQHLKNRTNFKDEFKSRLYLAKEIINKLGSITNKISRLKNGDIKEKNREKNIGNVEKF